MQLIYGGKTSQSLSKFNFPDSFSNTAESLKFLEDIIIPYLNTGEKLEVSKDQYALLILDIFSGQMTEHVKENLRENSILFVCVSANMTSLVHPQDLTVNLSFKTSMEKKFTEWYNLPIAGELDRGIPLDDIEIKLGLSVLKPVHAKWLMDTFNFMKSHAGSEVISNGWKTTGITEAPSIGLNDLESLDLFEYIDPLVKLNVTVDQSDQEVKKIILS